MRQIILIRHFATLGNENGKYIGITDEPLSKMGKKKSDGRTYPVVDAVFSSPMRRCLETAAIIYPDQIPQVEWNLAECNFGEFENKNYKELSINPQYEKWIQSNGTDSFPGGEKPEEFKKRSIAGFLNTLNTCEECGYQKVAFVIHGGTIMSILEKYAQPWQDFYTWKVANGEGYRFEIENVGERILGICNIRSLHL